ncbi:MAG: AI-2E family transporter [Burkholderiaceae bacterium]|jgi:predicted PurR-regulated permease PerM
MNTPQLQQKVFLWLVMLLSIAFLGILLPFYGAVFWAVVLAVLFDPLYTRLASKWPKRRNLAALATLGICLLCVIFPLILLTASLIQQASIVYQGIQSGQIDFGWYFQQIIAVLPRWLIRLLDRFNLSDLAGLQARLSAAALQGSQLLAKQAFSIGQNMFDFVVSFFVMLYLLFFLMRDGRDIMAQIRRATPLGLQHKASLFERLTTVIRATVKGNVAVAAVQGMLGGLIFTVLGIEAALLWGVLMAFLSLLPSIGAAIVWGPVALYFLLTGALVKCLVLVLFGVLVIGLVDNLLRPLLVGKDSHIPDYLVLLSTLGGMAVFGLNGFVIGPVVAAVFVATWGLFAQSIEE